VISWEATFYRFILVLKDLSARALIPVLKKGFLAFWIAVCDLRPILVALYLATENFIPLVLLSECVILPFFHRIPLIAKNAPYNAIAQSPMLAVIIQPRQNAIDLIAVICSPLYYLTAQ